MSDTVLPVLIANVFDNIESPDCFQELTEYLKSTYQDAFKYISRGNIMFNTPDRGHDFSIVFKNIYADSNVKYLLLKRDIVPIMRSLGYSADIYVVGKVGVILQVRSKEFRQFFDKIREEKKANLKKELSEE